ncbi:hypothetical protein E2C01_091138 [Portunus trituberculatus]|uniref:Uncharacterized protein n=1 Tax=Portunus trituberculatus TaxID=210409 RepID=A0A5B7JGL2_PORTR|nr:hypothetical protein [Portunus trituberculatus]
MKSPEHLPSPSIRRRLRIPLTTTTTTTITTTPAVPVIREQAPVTGSCCRYVYTEEAARGLTPGALRARRDLERRAGERR